MAIHVTIDELVLHGVDRRDRDAIAEAIRQAIVEHVDAKAVAGHTAPADAARTVTVRDHRAAELGAGAGRAIASVVNGGDR